MMRRALCLPLSCSHTVATPAQAGTSQAAAGRPSLGAATSRWQLSSPPIAFKLTGGSPEAKVAPVGCAVAPPISGLLTIEGIPVTGLVDTGASVTCLGFAIWWRYRAQWGALKPFPVRYMVPMVNLSRLQVGPSIWISSG